MFLMLVLDRPASPVEEGSIRCLLFEFVLFRLFRGARVETRVPLPILVLGSTYVDTENSSPEDSDSSDGRSRAVARF